jgi:hypothetical protein
MTNLHQHHDRLAFIRRDHWHQFESPSEHDERADAAEDAATRFFDMATAGQRGAYRAAVEGLAGWNTPFDNRAREAALARWYASTAEARKLFEIAFEDLMRDSEVSEVTAALWNALPDFVDLREVA